MKNAPSPSIHPLLHLLPGRLRYRVALGPRFLRDPLGFFTESVREHGDIVAFSPGRIFLINHPDYIKHVLQDNHPNYRKGLEMTKMLQPFFGQGLLTSEGPLWLRQRRLAQPAFHRRHSPEMMKLMTESTAAMLRRWDTTAGQFRERRDDLTELTLDILLKGLLGTDWGEDPKGLMDAVLELEEALALVSSFSDPFQPPLWLPTPRNRKIKHALEAADHWMYRLIASRRRNGNPGNDLLALLMEARDADTGEGMSDRQLRDELLTLLRTGHSTLRELVLWTWYLFATNPEAEQRFYAEVDSVLGDRPPTYEDLPKLPFTLMAIHESMRLYPPAWVFVRAALGDDEIGGFRIPAGAMVVMCPYVTQRSEEWWPDPEKFDPERFMPERSGNRPKFAYLPFGGGPRLCIGNNFALMEAQVILAMVAQRFRLEVDPNHTLKRVLFVSMMAHNLWIKMLPRGQGVQ
ncbi:MAG: cytochrome P450 [Bryobacteraceae bacterium]